MVIIIINVHGTPTRFKWVAWYQEVHDAEGVVGSEKPFLAKISSSLYFDVFLIQSRRRCVN